MTKEPRTYNGERIVSSINKQTNIYNGILLSYNKEGSLAICDNMDGPWGHYFKLSKSEKDKYCMVSLICGIKKQPPPNTHQTSDYQWGDRRGNGKTGVGD